jgi:hypothetical protein
LTTKKETNVVYEIKNLKQYFELIELYGKVEAAPARRDELLAKIYGDSQPRVFHNRAVFAHEHGIMLVEFAKGNGKYVVSMASTYDNAPEVEPRDPNNRLQAVRSVAKGKEGHFFMQWSAGPNATPVWSVKTSHVAPTELHFWWDHRQGTKELTREDINRFAQAAATKKWKWAKQGVVDFLSLCRVHELIEREYANLGELYDVIIAWQAANEHLLSERDDKLAKKQANRQATE